MRPDLSLITIDAAGPVSMARLFAATADAYRRGCLKCIEVGAPVLAGFAAREDLRFRLLAIKYSKDHIARFVESLL